MFLTISGNSDEKFYLSLKSDQNDGYFTKDQNIFLILSWSVLLRTRVVEKIKKNTFYVQ